MNQRVNGKKEGIWKYYHSNGNLWYECFYKNGLLEGLYKSYYSNGSLFYKNFNSKY